MANEKQQSMKDFTAEIRHKLETDERWMLVGMLTIHKFQTYDERKQMDTTLNNGVGFSGADGNVMSRLIKWLRNTKGQTEASIRANQNVKLADFYDDWAIKIIRKKMPRYAGQLAKISRGIIKPEDAYDK